jgi:LAO/AO transport system kinase
MVDEHRTFLEREGGLEERRRRNLAGEVYAVVSARAKAHLERAVGSDPGLQQLLDDVQARRLDPLSAVTEILSRVFGVDDGADGR